MTSTAETTNDTPPVDIATMRQTIGQLLPPGDADPLDLSEVENLTALLRDHMELVIPEVHAFILTLPRDDAPRYCALACVGEARGRLDRPATGPGQHDPLAHARWLARSLNALCDHYEALTGVRMCLACDRPIQDGEATRPYDHAGLPGGTGPAGRIHERCAGEA